MSENEVNENCPICFKSFPVGEIEVHANRCIFLNFQEPADQTKRKRTPSPTMYPQKSPKLQKSSKPSTQTSQFPLAKIFNTPKETPTNKTKEIPWNKTIDTKETKEKLPKQEFDANFVVPLAKQVVPKNLDDFFGQNHILGEKSVLRTLLGKGEIPNMILWGPPGCGKTSLATVIQGICKSNPKRFKYSQMSATNSGVKDVQNIVSASKLESKFGRLTVLFMDEIHRFNKKQQDTFLPHVEKGEIVLVGATTENPSFSINSALLSRCRVIVMNKLNSDELLSILIRATKCFDVTVIDEDSDISRTGEKVAIEKGALAWLADISDGDARIALSNLQLVLQHNADKHDRIINTDDIKDEIKKSHMLYDRQGEEHYNIISAMHKSIRGSDADAALYWTTRMIVSGEDPMFVARRMVRAASEDIGNADPNALQLAVSTMQGCHLLGKPECDVLLAQCAIYLARAPKSREADAALGAAKECIMNCKGAQPAVPMHIRNAPTRLMKDLGYGRLANGAVWSFMPAGLEDVKFLN